MRLCPWAGWMNGWWVALATVGLACLGVCHRAQGQPLSESLSVSVDASLSLPSEELRAAIASELGLAAQEVREAHGSDAQGALIQVSEADENRIRVCDRDPTGQLRERTIDKSTDPKNNVRIVTWLVGNLVRNQADTPSDDNVPATAPVAAVEPKPKETSPPAASKQAPAPVNAKADEDAAPWLISARAGASFSANMLGGHLGVGVSYQWPYVALGTELQLTAGSLSDVLVTREQQVTSPSLEFSYQDGSFFAFTWPIFAGLHFETKVISVEIGTGPGLRVTYLSADNMSGVAVEPVLHGHVELAVKVNRGFRVALRPFINYAFFDQTVVSFEERQVTEPAIVFSEAEIDPLIEGGLSLGLQWSY